MNRAADGRFQITFETTRIHKFISHIAEVSTVATAIYHLAKTGNLDDINPLETDGLSIAFVDEHGKSNVTAEKILEWVFRKAYEDFSIGLTQSLIECYIFLKTASLAAKYESVISPKESILQKELNAIHSTAHKLNFPTLINNIEKMINGQLLLKDEILSINQVRNCLVHKDAIVTESPAINLKYLKMQMFVQKDGEMIELTKNVKSHKFPVEKLEFQSVPMSLIYEMGDRVVITPDIFKDVTYTCILFFNELVYKLPLPQDFKDQIVNPFKMNIVTA